jgi:hypothetical protein
VALKPRAVGRACEAAVYSEIVPFNRADEALKRLAPKAIILSGGFSSAHEPGTPNGPAEPTLTRRYRRCAIRNTHTQYAQPKLCGASLAGSTGSSRPLGRCAPEIRAF